MFLQGEQHQPTKGEQKVSSIKPSMKLKQANLRLTVYIPVHFWNPFSQAPTQV